MCARTRFVHERWCRTYFKFLFHMLECVSHLTQGVLGQAFWAGSLAHAERAVQCAHTLQQGRASRHTESWVVFAELEKYTDPWRKVRIRGETFIKHTHTED